MNVVERPSAQQIDMIVEKDVRIRTRDGAFVVADIFRPSKPGTYPPILCLGPYQKDELWVPPPDVEEEPNEYMCWETANPLWWVPRGYVLVRIDARGTGKSPGKFDAGGPQEAQDFYDSIEWAAKQPWSNGKVGLLGISYYAANQWRVASLQPPSLAAIIPWEGWGDCYRDRTYHGGIYSQDFISNWQSKYMARHLLGPAYGYNPDAFRNEALWDGMRNNLDGDYWRLRSAQWDKIDVPLLSVGNWGGHGLHLRGNIDGFTKSVSKHKKLRIHSGTHFHPFHTEDSRNEQLRFFEHWLKGVQNGVMEEPPIKMMVRRGGGGPYEWRFEDQWPLRGTKWTKVYLGPQPQGATPQGTVRGGLSFKPVDTVASLSYSGTAMGKSGIPGASWALAVSGAASSTGVSFESEPLEQDAELTGPMSLTIWVSSTREDMDIFASLRNIDAGGKDVWEIGPQGQQMPLAKGWLRASHRKLDSAKSNPYRPYHAHDERIPLTPGKPVKCEVEIWPTCIVLKKGHRIRLDVQPMDGVGSAPYTHYHNDYNRGTHTVHFGGEYDSHLLLPVIPKER